MEEQCIENLKKTQDYMKKNNDGNIRFNNFQKMQFNDSNNNYNRKKTAHSAKKRNNNLINKSI